MRCHTSATVPSGGLYSAIVPPESGPSLGQPVSSEDAIQLRQIERGPRRFEKVMHAQLVLGTPELQRDRHEMFRREDAQHFLARAQLDGLPDGLLVKQSGGGQHLNRNSVDGR